MKYLLGIVLTLLIGSCSTPSSEKSEATNTQSTTITIDGLTLNNGERWIANEETEQGMQTMKQRLTNFTAADVESYNALGNEFSVIKDDIIAQCDMKGKPHDQLHLVLLPMLEEIKTLQDTETKEAGAKALYKLESLLELYFQHFTTQ